MSNNPKMSHKEALTLWSTLSPAQRAQFNEMLAKMQNGELMLKHVNVDDNETIQNIVLEPKEKPSEDHAKYAKFFPQES